jgi:hypothetical protein
MDGEVDHSHSFSMPCAPRQIPVSCDIPSQAHLGKLLVRDFRDVAGDILGQLV